MPNAWPGIQEWLAMALGLGGGQSQPPHHCNLNCERPRSFEHVPDSHLQNQSHPHSLQRLSTLLIGTDYFLIRAASSAQALT